MSPVTLPRALVFALLVMTVVLVTLHVSSYGTRFHDAVGIDRLLDLTRNAVKAELSQVTEDYGEGPLAFVRKNAYLKNLANLDLDNMTSEQLLLTIHTYPDNTDVICKRRFRMGKIGDGGWEICDDPEYRPRAPCVIYSYGINYDFSFDDDASKLYGCHVYSFDPSMTRAEEQFNRSDLVHFYNFGLSDKNYVTNKNWHMYTHGDLKKKLGHDKVKIEVVKMDIEGSEWQAIPEMAATGQLETIGQFLVEFHVTKSTREYILPKLKTIQAIERAGFRRFYAHKNHACGQKVKDFPAARTSCYEVHYIRM